MLGDVGLIDYIDMQRSVLNRPRHSGIALIEAGATERRIAAVATFESAQLLVIKNTYIVPLHHTTSPYTSPSHGTQQTGRRRRYIRYGGQDRIWSPSVRARDRRRRWTRRRRRAASEARGRGGGAALEDQEEEGQEVQQTG